MLSCPCICCNNCLQQKQETMYDHLLDIRIARNYVRWLMYGEYVTSPTRHTVSSDDVIFFYKLIIFKLVHSYNVQHLTCTIFCSSGLQNIYKLHI